MILEGTLKQFSLREILELMIDSSVTGALEVQTPRGPGYIYAHMGQLYHATCDNQSGSPAVWSMFEQEDGAFRFIAGEQAGERTLIEDLSTLANEAEERARNWSQVKHAIPSVHMVPTFEAGSGSDHIQISEQDWPVMAAIDGQRTIKEIADHLIVDPLDVCKALMRLMERQLVRLTREEQPEASRLFKGHMRSSQPGQTKGGGGLLARTLASVADEMLSPPPPTARRDHAPERPAPAKLEQEDDDIVRLLRGV